MKFVIRSFMAVCVLLMATAAMAQTSSFVALPFAVEAPEGNAYLGKAVSSTLTSRLAATDKVVPVKGEVPATFSGSAADAARIQKSLGADTVVWGKVVVLGKDCTLEAQALNAKGEQWTRSVEGELSSLQNAVNKLAILVAAEVMRLDVHPMALSSTKTKEAVAPVTSSGIIINETGEQKSASYYLNPQFKYQGGGGSEDGSRIHSQRLNYSMVDMAVGDFNGDGKNEVAILANHKVHIYAWDRGQMKPLGEKTVSMSNNTFSMRAIDLARDGAKELVIVTYAEDSQRTASYIYSFKDNSLSEYCKRSEYFLSVAKLPPLYEPVLVGQAWDSTKLFRPGVYRMEKSGDKLVRSTRVDLPEGARVFNFAWLPAGSKTQDGDKILMFNNDEKIKVYNAKGTLMHTTAEPYSGSAAGMDYYSTMDGLGKDKRYQIPEKYFAPMRIVNFVDGDGNSLALFNKPTSTASQLFDRYRFFPQGEIHALNWDGVGMNLKWKTRRIKGSVADLDIADVNNDGMLDLVVGINSSPSLGVGSRSCMVVAYPLDFSQVEGTVDRNDMEAQ